VDGDGDVRELADGETPPAGVAEGPTATATARASASAFPTCAHCPFVAHGVSGRTSDDFAEGDLEGLALHCSRYSGAGWAFRCPDPPWLPAIDPSNPSGDRDATNAPRRATSET
jgi:hypothetical protein